MRLPHLLLIALLTIVFGGAAFAGGGPSQVVVLLNENSEDSQRVAQHYAEARNIPSTQICRVKCSTELTVPIADFMRDVGDPLRAFLRRNELEDRCRFVVLTQGMPIRAKTGGNHVSTAAVLAVLDSSVAGRDQARLPKFVNRYLSGVAPTLADPQYGRLRLVTALLSSTADEALALIDRSTASDGTAPKKAHVVFQDARGNANVRNGMYDAARKPLEVRGHTTEHAKVGADVVKDRKRVMAYMGGGAYSALTPAGVATNEYLPGAIAEMLQSYGAVPENFIPGGKGKQFPITHFVRAGITGVHGAVAEPYTLAFPPADLFHAYFRGFTLAETYHQRIPTAYWMNLVLGDPLCAPYAVRPVPKITVDGKAFTSSALVPGATLQLSAGGAEAKLFRVFLDGHPLGELHAAKGDLILPTPLPAAGGRVLLVEAIAKHETEACGWAVHKVDVPPRAPSPSTAGPTASTTEALAFELPPEAIAGRNFEIGVTGGVPGAKAFVEMRTSTPPVRWLAESVTFDEKGNGRLQFSFSGAGSKDLLFTVLDDRRSSGPRRITIQPSAPHHATTPLSSVPERQVIDVPVRIEDQFGNLVRSFDGEVALKAAGVDAPESVAFNGSGLVVLRDVLFPRAGPIGLQILLNGRVFSNPGEGVRVGKGSVRSWLAANAVPQSDPRAAALAKGDPGASANVHGDVSSGLLFLRLRSARDEVLLPTAGAGNGSTGVAVAWVHAYQDMEVDLRFAARGPARILVDGKELHAGAPPSTDTKKPKSIGKAKLTKGRHRITVVAQRAGRFGFALALADAKGKLPGGLRILAAGDADLTGRVVSGTVRRSGSPARGIEVQLRGGPSARSTKTDAAGQYHFADVPEKALTVHLMGVDDATPASRSVDGDEPRFTDLNFAVVDRVAPTVAWPKLPAQPRFSRTLTLTPQVKDIGGIARVVLLVDGREVARVTRAPWKLVWARPEDDANRKVKLQISAVDRAGNSGKSTELTVTLTTDRKAPTLKLKGLRRNQRLKSPAKVEIRTIDDVSAVTLIVTVDGAAIATVLDAKGLATVVLDPAKLKDGKHELTCVVRDADGNETSRSVPFRSGK